MKTDKKIALDNSTHIFFFIITDDTKLNFEKYVVWKVARLGIGLSKNL